MIPERGDRRVFSGHRLRAAAGVFGHRCSDRRARPAVLDASGLESSPDVPRFHLIIDWRNRPCAQYSVLRCPAVLRGESARALGPESARHLGTDQLAAYQGSISTRRENTRSTDREQVSYAPGWVTADRPTLLPIGATLNWARCANRNHESAGSRSWSWCSDYFIALLSIPAAAQPTDDSVQSFKLKTPVRAAAVAYESDFWCYQFGAGIDLRCETVRESGFTADRHADPKAGSPAAAEVRRVIKGLKVQSRVREVYDRPDERQNCVLDNDRGTRGDHPVRYSNQRWPPADENCDVACSLRCYLERKYCDVVWCLLKRSWRDVTCCLWCSLKCAFKVASEPAACSPNSSCRRDSLPLRSTPLPLRRTLLPLHRTPKSKHSLPLRCTPLRNAIRCCRRIALNRRVAACCRSPTCRWCATCLHFSTCQHDTAYWKVARDSWKAGQIVDAAIESPPQVAGEGSPDKARCLRSCSIWIRRRVAPAERSVAARSSKSPRRAEFKYTGSHSSDLPRHSESRPPPPAAESSAVPAAESIPEELAETPPLPYTHGFWFPDPASQPAPLIAADASDAVEEDKVVILTPDPNVSASS